MIEFNQCLQAKSIAVEFGGVRALQGVDLTLRGDEILGLIGPNGAGKTTFLNAITGFERRATGDVSIGPLHLTHCAPHAFVRHGVSRTFQGRHSFARLTSLENVEAAALSVVRSRGQARQLAKDGLSRFGLASRHGVLAGALSHGEERRLGIARAMVTAPRFLLLDEPAAGLDEEEGDELAATIATLQAERACGVLIVEHDMRLIMGLCQRIQVLDAGRTISVGSPDIVRRDPVVIAAYLGSRGMASD